jgi:hypothetical protein
MNFFPIHRSVGSLIFLLLFIGVNGDLSSQVLPTLTPAVNQISPADDLYHRALEAYLDGNYDQSILLTAQSLEKDPTYPKSKNLLAVLTSEKEKATKTVIWLPNTTPEPAPLVVPVPVQEKVAVRHDVQDLQTKLERFEGAQNRKNQEVNGQLKVIQELVRDNSSGQYEEVKRSQFEIVNRLQKVESSRGQDLRLIYVLCAASVLLSGGAVWRNTKKVKRS